ncbi:DUF3558 domain-containing protein [Lentzea albida]|uniref:DUF3558 domain-containing protein n=1 Tax=Lentzea albida TaxID=65499 RepID=A0A1H9NJX2_9PSEU|nr:DUF3558 domain-containing protein [Lentzea albida]SER36236.1 Protein of unknown function [Lentzea albida]
MSKSFLKVIAAASVLMAATACTGSGEQGKPSPTSGGSSSTSGTSGSAKELPKRPAELTLNGVDACKLLTAAQMASVKVTEAVPEQIEVNDFGKAPGCFYENGLKYAYTVVLVTTKGVPFWLSGSGNVDAKVVTVAGYGAAQLNFTGTNSVDCSVTVDVAEGQQLHMSYDPGTEKGDSQDQMCDKAGKAAELAVETLKTLK